MFLTASYIRFLLIFISLFILALSGCSEDKRPKKVSITKRTSETFETLRGKKREDHEKNTLRFGFDLRLGPKDDVRIYSPFVKYLQNTTGRRFRIKFTEKYEDTVENLGNGITHFAAIGALSYSRPTTP
jgi:phosphonate transport system substrate-binding protein